MTRPATRPARRRSGPPAPPADPGRPHLRPPTPPIPDGHLDTLAGLLPAFTARDRDRGRRDRILPIAEGLLRGRAALREGLHGRLRGQRHLLTTLLHAAHLAFQGDPHARLAALLRLQRHRLARHQDPDRRPWLEISPGRHYDRALTHTVALSYELDRPDGPSPRRLQTEAADLANRVLSYLILTEALSDRGPSRPAHSPDDS